MFTTYKIDMSVTLEHMAKSAGIPTSYEDTNEEAKSRNGKKRKRTHSYDSDEGPPDKMKDFSSG